MGPGMSSTAAGCSPLLLWGKLDCTLLYGNIIESNFPGNALPIQGIIRPTAQQWSEYNQGQGEGTEMSEVHDGLRFRANLQRTAGYEHVAQQVVYIDSIEGVFSDKADR